MIDHLSTYTTDFPRARQFYSSVLEPLGYPVQAEFVAKWNTEFPTQRLVAFGPQGKPVFWVIETQVEHSPRHVAFSAQNREMVAQFYQHGLQNFGTDNGAPGVRKEYHEHYFGAFLFDPDGNNVEAVCHAPENAY